jgi:hypothetical protein
MSRYAIQEGSWLALHPALSLYHQPQQAPAIIGVLGNLPGYMTSTLTDGYKVGCEQGSDSFGLWNG